jgi:Ca2+-binding RTX toxin-like protein
MRRVQQLVKILGLAAVITFASSEPAAALPLQAITLPSGGGTLRVGNYFGMIFAVFQPASGNCTIWGLSNKPYMVADLWVTGTSGEDEMEVFDVPGEQSNLICGERATAVDRNGFAVMFEGHGGDDYMKNGDIMIGGAGKDTIGTEGYSLAETGLAHIEGGADNDVLIAEKRNGATLLGGGGNDNLCVIGGIRAAVANGNTGSNKLFGRATSQTNVTTINSITDCLDGQ